MQLQQPPKPNKGSTVYIISPSAGLLPFVESRVKRTTRHLEALGFKVKIASHANKNSGYVSAPIDERVADIHEAFSDPACSIVMAAIGGDHSNQLIARLDYQLIRNNPKVFVGYSDNTVLHYAFATKANLQTYYGPCFLNQFGEFPEVLPYTLGYFNKAILLQDNNITVEPSKEYTDEVLDWFKEEDIKRPRKMVANSGYSWWRNGKASGWAMPCTIPSVNHLLGTDYMPDAKGAVLMLDIPEGNSMYEGESVAHIDAWLTDMDNAGILAKVNGIVIGRPYKYTPEMTDELKTVVLRITERYGYPVLYNVDMGHTDPVVTVPIAATVGLDSDKPYFRITA
ncbi:MAG TPA: S66 peptidase family protein [Candidatus Saccharimonadales bacterium]|nr:S66 peptidase family protein [Candidatus Saccharimonadales bacterium]